MPSTFTPIAPTGLRHRVLAGTETGVHIIGPNADSFDLGAVASIAAGPDGVWVLGADGTVWRVTDVGVDEIVQNPTEGARVLASDGSIVWIGGDEATLWRWDGDRLERASAFDEAPTHDEWHTPWGGPPDVFSIACRHGDVFVNVHVGGILRSSDRGASWTPTIDLHDDVHHVAVASSGTVWAATGKRGLARSIDRGATWDYFSEGLHSSYALGLAPTADSALVCTSSGPGRSDGRLYRLDGDRLVPSVDGLPDRLGGTVGGDRLASAGDEVAMAAPDGAIYVSTDGGRNWTRVTDPIGATKVTLAAPIDRGSVGVTADGPT